jgi:hypothetical protein
MVAIRGLLDPEGGAAVLEAIDARMRPPGPDDPRTVGQRRADALVDIARMALARGDLPTVGGMRPQVGILLTPQTLLYGQDGNDPYTRTHTRFGEAEPPDIGHLFDPHTGAGDDDIAGDDGAAGAAPPFDEPAADQAFDDEAFDDEALADDAFTDAQPRPVPRANARGDPLTPLGIPPPVEPAWLNWYGPVAPETAQRVFCDSDIWRIVLDPASGLPLDVGRAHRLVPHWIRRALHARDRGCRWPGCTTRPRGPTVIT